MLNPTEYRELRRKGGHPRTTEDEALQTVAKVQVTNSESTWTLLAPHPHPHPCDWGHESALGRGFQVRRKLTLEQEATTPCGFLQQFPTQLYRERGDE